MEINQLIKEAHDNAVNKGFHRDYDLLVNSIKEKVTPENIKQMDRLLGYVKLVEINKDINLIVTELSEASEHIRKRTLLTDSEKKYWKESFEEEIADAVIRIADLCGQYNIDLEYFIKEKMEYNKTRPNMHGKSIWI